jgi:hypothetical protein
MIIKILVGDAESKINNICDTKTTNVNLIRVPTTGQIRVLKACETK